MSRLKADLILFFVALVWGVAFLFQKHGVATVGVFTFVALRFGISAVLVLPLAVREFKTWPRLPQKIRFDLVILLIVFIVGVLLQHVGLLTTSVTNAGFLTGLYVIFVAFICRFLFKQNVSQFVTLAAVLSVVGVGFLSGGLDFAHFGRGDFWVLLCALAFGFQVAFIGRIMHAWPAPYTVSFLQYGVTIVIAGLLALGFEHPSLDAIWTARWAILYAGALSGGVAYTLQVVAQQFTPASDSAVIMSLESVFAALAGVLFGGDVFTISIAVGASLILGAILLVEFGPRGKKV